MNAHDALADLVISSKLVPPDVSHAIHRPRLVERLDRGVAGRLTLVIGPAGSGKNWLLSSWARTSGRLPGPLAWLTLDEEDDDPLRLCAHLIAALRGAVARVGGAAPLAVTVPPLASADSVGCLVTQLLNQLAQLPSPVVLVVENLHELTDGPASALVLRLVRHAPERLRLVLSARTVPELALRGLRLRGELTEIRSAELAFRMPELRELLAARSVDLPEAEAGRLLSGTGGQPLALRLALATLPDGDARSWPAMPKQLDLVHLRREVIDRLPEECREVLMRTSIVRETGPSLAQALTGRTEAAAILHRLAAEYDLLTALDPREPGGPVLYRHHPLIRELLRSEFGERTERRGIEAVHLAACDWYRRNGRLLEAARQAVAGGRHRLGLKLVRSVGYRLCVSGRARAVLDVLESVPDHRSEGDAHAVLLGAVARIAVDPGTDVSRQLRRAEELFEQVSAKPASATALIAFCRMVGDQYHGRVEASLCRAREAEEHLFLPDRPYQLDDDTRAALFLPYFGEFQWWSGRAGEARETLRRGRAAAERAGIEFAALHSRLVALRMDIGTGRPGGDDCARELLRTVESRGWALSPSRCAPLFYLAVPGWWGMVRPETRRGPGPCCAPSAPRSRDGQGGGTGDAWNPGPSAEGPKLLMSGKAIRTGPATASPRLRDRLETAHDRRTGLPPCTQVCWAAEPRSHWAMGLVGPGTGPACRPDIGPPDASARIAVVTRPGPRPSAGSRTGARHPALPAPPRLSLRWAVVTRAAARGRLRRGRIAHWTPLDTAAAATRRGWSRSLRRAAPRRLPPAVRRQRAGHVYRPACCARTARSGRTPRPPFVDGPAGEAPRQAASSRVRRQDVV
ncbi:hypothetical protein GCM10020221_25760 [Streptomyces thioluteus]|uniref:MalT-like winged helix domain-containing protein n=1 Tax=Streptomyces thioluteus TaxID=66431 RepID=A0ABN3WUY6_STRTU